MPRQIKLDFTAAEYQALHRGEASEYLKSLLLTLQNHVIRPLDPDHILVTSFSSYDDNSHYLSIIPNHMRVRVNLSEDQPPPPSLVLWLRAVEDPNGMTLQHKASKDNDWENGVWAKIRYGQPTLPRATRNKIYMRTAKIIRDYLTYHTIFLAAEPASTDNPAPHDGPDRPSPHKLPKQKPFSRRP